MLTLDRQRWLRKLALLEVILFVAKLMGMLLSSWATWGEVQSPAKENDGLQPQ